MKDEKIPLVEIDWNRISTGKEFYDCILPQCKSPTWHGRNLDALSDSWVTGGINRVGPPYRFRILNRNTTKDEMKSIEEAVEEIPKESAQENGGNLQIVESKQCQQGA